jgi:hypothetical protein
LAWWLYCSQGFSIPFQTPLTNLTLHFYLTKFSIYNADEVKIFIWCILRSCSWQGILIPSSLLYAFNYILYNTKSISDIHTYIHVFHSMQLMVAATLVLLCTRPLDAGVFGQAPWLLPIPSIAIIGREVMGNYLISITYFTYVISRGSFFVYHQIHAS